MDWQMNWRWIARIIGYGLSVSVLVSCATTKVPTQDRPLTDMQSTLHSGVSADKKIMNATKPPAEVTNALMPSLSAKSAAKENLNAERFDVSVDHVSSKAFYMGLVEGTPYNMVMDPGLQGSITLHLKNVTVADVMEAARDAYGYEYQRTKLGYRVFSNDLQTQIFNINYLNVKRNGTSETDVSSGISSDINNGTNNGTSGSSGTVYPSTGYYPPLIGGGSSYTNPNNSYTPTPAGGSTGSATSSTSVLTQSTADFWGTLKTSLEAIVGKEEGRSVVINPQAGVVVVRAKPAELRGVANYLDKIQNSMNRQVLIEAKVLEVTLNAGFQQGIDWTILGAKQTGNLSLKESGFTAFGTDETSTDNSIFNLKAGGGDDFAATIKLLSVQGDVQVLSSPRIATVNNQKALIKVGEDQFFVTNVASSTVANTTTTTGQSVQLTPFFSGIALDITPQIDSNGDVTLHVHPTVVQVTDQNKSITLGPNDTLSLPLALSEVREADSIVHAKNGQVVVIGGLMTNGYMDLNGMTPGLGQLPVVGNLFRSTERGWQKRELVILLRPIVIDNKTAAEQLSESEQEFKSTQARTRKMEKPIPITDWFGQPS